MTQQELQRLNNQALHLRVKSIAWFVLGITVAILAMLNWDLIIDKFILK